MQRARLRRFWLLIFLSGTLFPTFVAGQSSSLSANNPYEDQFHSLQRQFESAAAPQQAVLLRQGYDLRDYVDDRGVLAAWLQAVVSDTRTHRLVRDEAQWLLARIDRNQSQLSNAQSRYEGLGFIRKWSIVGPFSSASMDSTAGPESGFEPTKTYRDNSGRERRWREIPDIGPNAWIDLAAFYSRSASPVAFAATSIHSDERRTVALRFTSDAPFTLSLNGAAVFTRADASQAAFDQHAVGVELRPGWNAILVKFYRAADQPWRFGLRITEMQGGGVRLRASATQVASEAAAQPTPDGPLPDDLVDIARKSADAYATPAAWENLARIEQQHARGVPAESMQRALTSSADAEQWLRFAEMTNKSGERFRALNQALQADPKLAAAGIELAEYYIHRRQLEKARDFLRAAIASSPDDFVARKLLADVCRMAGLNSRAASEYRELEQRFPSPLWLKRTLAESWEELGVLDRAQELARSALRDNFDGIDERSVIERIAERQRDAATLQRSYDQRLQLSPNDTATLAKRAELKAGSGNFEKAGGDMRAAISIDPENEDLHRRFAEMLASAGDTANSKPEFEHALALNSQLENVRRRLQVHIEDDDRGYLVNAAELATQAHAQSPHTASPAVMLANVRIQRMYENDLDSVRVQQVTYVASEEGARQQRVARVQYRPGTEQLRILHARVYKTDGRVIDGEAEGDTAVSDANVAMYYDLRSKSIRLPGVEKGDVVELDYRLSPLLTTNPNGSYFGALVVFRTELEQRLQRYILIAPGARKLYTYEEGMQAPAIITSKGAQQILRWEARNVPALVNEPRGPALTEVAPYVHVSTFGSWEELGRWYAQLIRPQFQLDSALRQQLAQVIEGLASDEDKIHAIHRFVLRNTHYVALEFGIYSYKPYPVNEVYARRFGDCKDKASLMIALLHGAGIEAELALVRTRRLGAINRHPASISIFDHAIVYLPRYKLWLDGTAEYSGARELPLEDQGAMALTVALDGKSEVREIPVSSAAENVTRRKLQARINRNGTIEFTGDSTTRGEDAPGMRRDFEIIERQRDSIRRRLAEVFPTVRVEDVVVQGAYDLESDVTVQFRGTLDSFAGRKTLPLTASWMPSGYVERLAPLVTRTQDLRLPAPWRTEEELHFVLPGGALLASLPRDDRIESAFGAATMHFEERRGELIVRSQVQFRTRRIAPQEYVAFRRFCSELDRMLRQEVKVVLP